MKSFATTVILTVTLTTGTLVPAQTFEQSLAAVGRGDDRTAFAGFKKLAEQGHAKAQFNLGLMYRNGMGVPEDDLQAVAWYRKAADQGDANAQYNLGEIYRNDQGALKDEKAAYFWLLLASAQGHQNAARNRDFVVRRLTPEQRAAAETAAHNWKPKIQAQPIH
jgi:TPR repeat protein